MEGCSREVVFFLATINLVTNPPAMASCCREKPAVALYQDTTCHTMPRHATPRHATGRWICCLSSRAIRSGERSTGSMALVVFKNTPCPVLF